jgi:hypothetical protein
MAGTSNNTGELEQHYCQGILLGQAKNQMSYPGTLVAQYSGTKLRSATPSKKTTGRQTGFDAENHASLRGLKGYSTTVSPVRRDRQHRHEANKFTGYLATVDVARYEYGH